MATPQIYNVDSRCVEKDCMTRPRRNVLLCIFIYLIFVMNQLLLLHVVKKQWIYG